MRLLLDEHLDPAIAAALRREFRGLDVQSVEDPGWAGLDDAALLEVLDAENSVLMTRDINSMPEHLRRRLKDGLTHAGVVFVPRSIKQTDRRTLIRKLARLLKERVSEDWRCRIFWLAP
ncbi:MAG: DUF5615 family PIN-like protein [Verrucomicrobia bacterium]|nr:DUF5615 family PIN-like protein [Verrucomicrobiota bacterium]